MQQSTLFHCYAPGILNIKAEFNITIALISSISTSLCVILKLFEFSIKFILVNAIQTTCTGADPGLKEGEGCRGSGGPPPQKCLNL